MLKQWAGAVPLALALGTATAWAAQVPLAVPATSTRTHNVGVVPQSTTLVDLLSASPDHSHLLHLLQRARLIPTLNLLNGSTFFAPVNSAFEDEVRAEEQVEDKVFTWALTAKGSPDLPDNVQTALRQRILYHILNYTLPYEPEAAPTERPDMLETLLFPLPGRDPDAPGEPGKDPKPRVKGMLGGRGQQLRIIRRADSKSRRIEGDPATFVGVDSQGRGGSAVISGQNGTAVRARNGVLISLQKVLRAPPSLASLLSDPAVSKFRSVLPDTLVQHLETTPHVTLFAPSDAAWGNLTDLQWKFLASEKGQVSVMDLYGAHAAKDPVANSSVGYTQAFGRGGDEKVVQTIAHGSLAVKVDEAGKLSVNGTDAQAIDILASNGTSALHLAAIVPSKRAISGVLHIVSDLLTPGHTLQLSVEQYLLALNCTRFVDLFRSAGLASDYLNGTDSSDSPSWTILAPRDDVFEDLGTIGKSSVWEGGWRSIPPVGSEALIDTLQYHVVPGLWMPHDFNDGMLLGTELVIKHKLAGHRQRVSVSVSESDGKGSALSRLGKGKGEPDHAKGLVGFGGANVIAEPLVVGKSIIYLLSKVLEPPQNPVQVAVTDLRLSTFVAAVYAAELEKLFRSAPAVTLFVPSNSAFETLGLVMNYLLLQTARSELRSLLKYHVVDDILYSDDIEVGSKKWATLDGSNVFVERKEDGNVTLRGPTISGFPANGETRPAKVLDGDWLTSTGALHIIDQVELPPTMEIGIGKLMRGAKTETMVDLLRASNMTWVLDGSEPGEDLLQAWEQGSVGSAKKKKNQGKRVVKGFEERSFTVLCPTDTAFTRINLTYYLNNPPLLRNLVLQHIIPSDPPSKSAIRDPSLFPTDGRPIALEDGRTYPTLLSEGEGGSSKYGDVAFRSWGEGGWIVGIKNARGSSGEHDAGRVSQFGRATPRLIRDPDGHDDLELTGKAKPAKMAYGGGVLIIDAVLEPYEPSPWQKWGWIVATVLICVVGALAIIGMGWKLWRCVGLLCVTS